ncbi:hypothetical protein QQ045_031876 [Rhodiola kirilowii]
MNHTVQLVYSSLSGFPEIILADDFEYCGPAGIHGMWLAAVYPQRIQTLNFGRDINLVSNCIAVLALQMDRRDALEMILAVYQNHFTQMGSEIACYLELFDCCIHCIRASR